MFNADLRAAGEENFRSERAAGEENFRSARRRRRKFSIRAPQAKKNLDPRAAGEEKLSIRALSMSPC